MQFRPGASRQSFVDRCTKEMNRTVVDALGDDVLICGEPVRACFEFEAGEKFQFDNNSAGQISEMITLDWLKEDQPNVRSGDPVVFNGRTYTIKKGFPINMQDCWLRAELKDCGVCK